MRNTLGTSLAEVMVMMAILSLSLVGIYSMVNSGQTLASLTDTRLTALNIAREGLESVTTLRDTFVLAGFGSGTCTGGTNASFFTTDGSQILTGNCPEIGTGYVGYILDDTKHLTGVSNNTPVCINEFGWYSQEFSGIGSNDLSTCRLDPGIPGCKMCSSTMTLCGENTTTSCKTRFHRKITFESCAGESSEYCVIVRAKVWWGANENNNDTSLSLTQTITKND